MCIKRARSAVAGLDAGARWRRRGRRDRAQGYSGSGVIRDQARAQAAAIAPMTNSAAGMRLMVATMDHMFNRCSSRSVRPAPKTRGLRRVCGRWRPSYRSQTDLPGSRGDAKDSPPALPLDSQNMEALVIGGILPYVAGPGGVGREFRQMLRRGSRSVPAQVISCGLMSCPDLKFWRRENWVRRLCSDSPGNPDPYIQLGPNTGAWVPKSDSRARSLCLRTPRSSRPMGMTSLLPHSGIFVWHGELVPEPLQPGRPGLAAETHPAGH